MKLSDLIREWGRLLLKYIKGKEGIIVLIFFICFTVLQYALLPRIPMMFEIRVDTITGLVTDIKPKWFYIVVPPIISGLYSLLLYAFLEVVSRFPMRWRSFREDSLEGFYAALEVSLRSHVEWSMFNNILSTIRQRKTIVLPG